MFGMRMREALAALWDDDLVDEGGRRVVNPPPDDAVLSADGREPPLNPPPLPALLAVCSASSPPSPPTRGTEAHRWLGGEERKSSNALPLPLAWEGVVVVGVGRLIQVGGFEGLVEGEGGRVGGDGLAVHYVGFRGALDGYKGAGERICVVSLAA